MSTGAHVEMFDVLSVALAPEDHGHAVDAPPAGRRYSTRCASDFSRRSSCLSTGFAMLEAMALVGGIATASLSPDVTPGIEGWSAADRRGSPRRLPSPLLE